MDSKTKIRLLLLVGILKKIVIVFLFSSGYMNAQEIQYINSPEHLAQEMPFSEATIVNNVVYLSGQIGSNAKNEVVSGGITAETAQALRNIQALLERMNLSLEHVFKCTCMLSDIKDWPAMSKAYKGFFSPNKLPARSAFAGSGLALGAKVEIECMATLQ